MKIVVMIVSFAPLTGCVAQPYRPIVDPGTRIGDYDADPGSVATQTESMSK